MAKKIKFGLKMADDADVRSIEDLREHFDLVKAIEYFTSGKLLEWLEDRFYDEAEKIGQLDKDAPDFQRQLCEILGVEPPEDVNEERDIDAIARAKEKEVILKQKTSDEQIIANAAKTAFDRDDLEELWGAGEETIYLCGDELFNIPLRVENVKYIGILGTPKITISAKSREELAEKGIEFENVELPEALREKKAEETKTCEYCGLANPASAKFCNGCGAAMENNRNDEKEIVAATAGAIEMADDATNPLTMEELRYIFIQNFPEFNDGKIWRLLKPEKGVIPNYYTCDFNDMQKKLALNLICKGKYSEKDIIQIAVSDDCLYGWAVTKNSLCVVHKNSVFSTSYTGIIQYADIVHMNQIGDYGSLLEVRIKQEGKRINARLQNDCFGSFDDFSNYPLSKLAKYLEAVRKFYPGEMETDSWGFFSSFQKNTLIS